MPRSRRLELLVAGFCALTIAGCRGDSTLRAEGKAGLRAPAGEPRAVRTQPVVLSSFEDVIEVSGTLAADEQVTLATKVPGRLASLAVDLASPVRQGESVAQIETTDFEFGVQQAEAALGQARAQLGLAPGQSAGAIEVDSVAVVREALATLEEAQASAARLETLTREGVSPAAELESARATLGRAKAALESAREEVRLRQAQVRQRESELRVARQRLLDAAIRSPIDGYVQARRASVGEYLAAGAPVAEVVRIDPLRLRLAIPEREAELVREGQVVRVSLDAGAGERAPAHSGAVARLAPGLDPESRTLLIEADIPNSGRLRPGNFVRAQIVVGQRQAPAVPESAIVTFAGLQKVIVVVEGKAVEHTVTIGVAREGAVEIVSGVTPGESVVIAPGSLQQGDPVRVEAP